MSTIGRKPVFAWPAAKATAKTDRKSTRLNSSHGSISYAVFCLKKKKNPYLLDGKGVLLSGASQELLAFLEKTGIPGCSTLLGLGAFPSDHPNYVGFLGMHGNYGPNVNTNECDVLIGIGMRFDDRVPGNVNRYAKQARIIHIDIDKAEINKVIQSDIAVHADAKEALQALIGYCQP